jgi:hypothetical protein
MFHLVNIGRLTAIRAYEYNLEKAMFLLFCVVFEALKYATKHHT